MKRILATSSSFPEDYDRKWKIDVIPFVSIDIYPKEKIISQIPTDIHSFIVTSKNSAKAIKEIELNGQFFVVGKSTAKKLNGQDREISFISNYSEDLLERMLETDIKNYVFFKGNLSLTTLPDILKENGIEVRGIETYKTSLTPQKVTDFYDAIIFMSPSAVKSFTSMNKIPEETLIFTSGKTTAEAVKQHGNYRVYFPEETTKESLIALINDKLDA
ncbi:uroporphyrinogen-III synthase [Apibacter sp. HY039]|uniref:uroporphyrinogen-III synthase n=1 Tax=Apibacter sp. HY039 TaxID=2501476 RepID=UPI000FEB62E8|nr:uroporphyrinogen-III synthase [Apibacter sp. HY039]